MSLAQFHETLHLNKLLSVLNDNWALLDTALTGKICRLRKYAEDESLILVSNVNDHMTANRIRPHKDLGFEVRYNKNSLANIISMVDILKVSVSSIAVNLLFILVLLFISKENINFLCSEYDLHYFYHTNLENHLLFDQI